MDDIETALMSNHYWTRSGAAGSINTTYSGPSDGAPGQCVDETRDLSQTRYVKIFCIPDLIPELSVILTHNLSDFGVKEVCTLKVQSFDHVFCSVSTGPLILICSNFCKFARAITFVPLKYAP